MCILEYVVVFAGWSFIFCIVTAWTLEPWIYQDCVHIAKFGICWGIFCVFTWLITYWIFLAYSIYRKYKSTKRESIKMNSEQYYSIIKNGQLYELRKNGVVLCTLNNSILQKELFFEVSIIEIGDESIVVRNGDNKDIELTYEDRKVKPVFPMTMTKLVEYFVELYKPDLEQKIKELKILTKISGLNEISNDDILAYLEE